jgi:hypothetical protein
MIDPYANAHNTAIYGQAEMVEADLVAMAQCQPAPTPVYIDYQPYHLRMECINMALRVPDGAPPPPLAEVMERAAAYWAFMQDGAPLFLQKGEKAG